MNEDDVVKIFEDNGFIEVFCENLSMEEKIGLLRSAKMVAGPIGGGMCNLLFSKPSTKVISINSPMFFDVNSRFRFSMEHTQLTNFNDTWFCEDTYQSAHEENKHALSIAGGINSPWKANIDKLKDVVSGVVNDR